VTVSVSAASVCESGCQCAKIAHCTLFGFGDVSGFDLRSMALAVGGGIVVLLLYGLATKARA
jgi:hypothetical protein